MKTSTYRETPFFKWWGMAHAAFLERGAPPPSLQDAQAAYEAGESPFTWADYVVNAAPPQAEG